MREAADHVDAVSRHGCRCLGADDKIACAHAAPSKCLANIARTKAERLSPCWNAALRAVRIKSGGSDMPALLARLLAGIDFRAMRQHLSRLGKTWQAKKWGLLPTPQKLTRIGK